MLVPLATRHPLSSLHMTDLLHIIPDFPIKSYDHLIPRLEQHLVTTIDLLTLDAVEIHKRTKLGLVDIQRLAAHVTAVLQQQLDLRVEDEQRFKATFRREGKNGDILRRPGSDLVKAWSTISTLDEEVDAILGGGIPASYITEITGERYVKLHSTSAWWLICVLRLVVQGRLNSC